MELDVAGLRLRAGVLRAVRRWFEDQGYLEVPTPAIVRSPAMEENLHALGVGGGFLRTSPEFALKRVVAAGIHRAYEIGPCFRDDEDGSWHGREFTMIEWYRVGAHQDEMMAEVIALVDVAFGSAGVSPPAAWRRTTVRELFEDTVGIDLSAASAHDLSPRDDDWDEAFFRRWVEDIEPGLTGAVLVSDWPASQAALARVYAGGWPVARRFEAYIGGIELANAFVELTDADEQRRRFGVANARRALAGKPPHPVDDRFVAAVGRLPATTGVAMGLDRLVAAVAGWDGIRRGRVS